jgi:hypothetical protein
MADLNTVQNCRQAPVGISGQGDNLVLQNATGPITIYGLTIVAATAVAVTLKSGQTLLTGPMPLVADGSIDFAPTFERFVCGAGLGTNGGFFINLSSATQVSGVVYFKYGR